MSRNVIPGFSRDRIYSISVVSNPR